MLLHDDSEFRGIALLSAFNTRRELILEETLTIDNYYEDKHPMIDDDDFRKHHHIRFINGRIYDYDGKLGQEFNNEYDEEGAYIRGRAVHADGTIIEN